MVRLPAPSESDLPMTRDEAKARGLKVFPAWVHCRKSSKHGNLRVTSSNRCAACAQLEADITRDRQAKLKGRLQREAERQVRKQLAQEIADAKQEAQNILRAAQREAIDRARMLEKAQATRAANKAKKAAEATSKATQAPPPGLPFAEPLEGLREAVNVSGLVATCPWD